MSVTSALFWVGALAALVVIAHRFGFRSRPESYRFAAVAAGILVLGAVTDVSAETAPLVVVLVGAAGLWLAARFRGNRGAQLRRQSFRPVGPTVNVTEPSDALVERREPLQAIVADVRCDMVGAVGIEPTTSPV